MTLFAPVDLAGSRFWVRHVHQTVATFIEEQLDHLGWVNSPVNFGTQGFVFEEIEPEAAGEGDLAYNTVSITLGDTPAEEPEEIGASFYSVSIPVFVDVYAVEQSIAVSVCDDVRRVLTDMAIPLFDFTAAPPTPFDGSYIEFEQVIGPRRPQTSIEAVAPMVRNWRIVKALAVTYFSAP